MVSSSYWSLYSERAERLSVGSEYRRRWWDERSDGLDSWWSLGREDGSRLVPVGLLWIRDSISWQSSGQVLVAWSTYWYLCARLLYEVNDELPRAMMMVFLMALSVGRWFMGVLGGCRVAHASSSASSALM